MTRLVRVFIEVEKDQGYSVQQARKGIHRGRKEGKKRTSQAKGTLESEFDWLKITDVVFISDSMRLRTVNKCLTSFKTEKEDASSTIRANRMIFRY